MNFEYLATSSCYLIIFSFSEIMGNNLFIDRILCRATKNYIITPHLTVSTIVHTMKRKNKICTLHFHCSHPFFIIRICLVKMLWWYFIYNLSLHLSLLRLKIQGIRNSIFSLICTCIFRSSINIEWKWSRTK